MRSAAEKSLESVGFALDGLGLESDHVPDVSQDPSAAGVPTGHVFRVERARGPVWYAKYRLTDGRQVQKKIGPAWTERGRPANGYFTKRTAEAWLRDVLDQVRRGALPAAERTGVTFADSRGRGRLAALHRGGPRPQAVDGPRLSGDGAHPDAAELRVDRDRGDTPAAIEAWLGSLRLAASSRTPALVLMHGIFQRAQGVRAGPTPSPMSRSRP